MSPLGRYLLTLCDEYMCVNVQEIHIWFPCLTYGQIEHYALRLGLQIWHP